MHSECDQMNGVHEKRNDFRTPIGDDQAGFTTQPTAVKDDVLYSKEEHDDSHQARDVEAFQSPADGTLCYSHIKHQKAYSPPA